MAVSPKGKRKIIVNGRLYWWFVKNDDYYNSASSNPLGLQSVNIVSNDNHFAISYHIDTDFVKIIGREFHPQLMRKQGCHQRFFCPNIYFNSGEKNSRQGTITPALVKTIIDWCCQDKAMLKELDWSELKEIRPPYPSPLKSTMSL